MRTAIFETLQRITPGYRKNLASKTAQAWKHLNSFSQYDEDLILTKLVEKMDCPHNFIEFGFAPLENNCLRLALKQGWSGLFIDPISEHVRLVNDTVPYFTGLNLRAIKSFLTLDNIETVVHSDNPVGVLSIDVDGNDFYFWERLFIHPEIVVIEYNPVFGDRSITVPYDDNFVRFKVHKSGLYHGASLTALEKLGKNRGYSLVGCSTFGANAFFVRNDCLSVPTISAKEALEKGVHVLVRGKKPSEHWDSIKNLPFVEIV